MSKQRKPHLPPEVLTEEGQAQAATVLRAKKNHRIYRAHNGRVDDFQITKGEPVVVPEEYYPSLRAEGVI